MLVATSPENRPKGPVVCLSRSKAWVPKSTMIPQGQRPGNLLVYERSQMVGPLALMFLLFRQPRPSTYLWDRGVRLGAFGMVRWLVMST